MHRATRTRRSLGLSSVANKSVSSVCMMGGVMKSITVAAHRIINQVDNIHLYFSRPLLAASRHRLRRGAELECFRVEIIGSDTRGEERWTVETCLTIVEIQDWSSVAV